MSGGTDFYTVKVEEATIRDLSDSLGFAVKSGPANLTMTQYPCPSPSSSALNFSVIIPSENVVIDRHLQIRTGLTFQLRIAGGGLVVGSTVFTYGLDNAFQAYPFASCVNTVSCAINNATVSTSLRDVKDCILRMNDSRLQYEFCSTTPTLPDQAWYNYSDSIRSTSSPLASYNTCSYDVAQSPRGAFPAVISCVRTSAGVQSETNVVATANDSFIITVSTIVTEPIVGLSPWIWTGPSEIHQGGLVGVNNINMQYTIDSTLSRIWSSANGLITSITPGIQTVPTVGPFAGLAASSLLFYAPLGVGSLGSGLGAPTLLFKLMSTQPTSVISSRCVVPYAELPRYILSQVPVTVAAGATTTMTSSSVQLSSVPDKIFIFARKQMALQNWNDSASFAVIKQVSISFNNSAGLLSSAQPSDLWKLSSINGSTQSYAEFSGYAYQSIYGAGGYNGLVGTTGSILVLDPALNFSLPPFLSASSLGAFSLQVQVQVQNQADEAVPLELVIVCMNSGVFVVQQGLSSVFTGLLTKQAVLDAMSTKAADTVSSMQLARLTGGAGFMGSDHRRSKSPERMERRVGGAMSAAGRSRLDSLV